MSRLRSRLRDEHGFTLLLALGILTITSLLTGALFLAVNSDAGLTRDDLSGKQAYAAAQAGAQAYLFELNHNSAASKWWQTCSNDIDKKATPVPGSTDESYTFHPVIACQTNQAVGTVLDPTTGQLRIEFSGTSGTASRTLVVAFRTLSPLSYLWYTKYETVDPVIDPTGHCDRYYRDNPGPDTSCDIEWTTGDLVKGPMFTQDQFLIGGTPKFGRGPADSIASSAVTPSVCVNIHADQETCPEGVINGTEDAGAFPVPLPADNKSLEADAYANGIVLPGSTTLTISGSTATALTCDGTHLCQSKLIDLTQDPIIYVADATDVPTPCVPSYDPRDVGSLPTPAGPCGTVYLQTSSYSVPVTIAAENDIVIQGDVLNGKPSPVTAMPSSTSTATLGLVADRYVRVWHPTLKSGSDYCNAPNPNRTIDAAILTLQHSFFVDNYECGAGAYGTLTVNGAIAQYFRGVVGKPGFNGVYPGYLKDYNYDNRLAYLLPPYLFDLQDASWQVVRETLCASGLPASSAGSCLDQG